ncbi:hypothetical protein [Spirosoma validum]|nr:hypothetical protein [Spirosoma validum]
MPTGNPASFQIRTGTKAQFIRPAARLEQNGLSKVSYVLTEVF